VYFEFLRNVVRPIPKYYLRIRPCVPLVTGTQVLGRLPRKSVFAQYAAFSSFFAAVSLVTAAGLEEAAATSLQAAAMMLHQKISAHHLKRLIVAHRTDRPLCLFFRTSRSAEPASTKAKPVPHTPGKVPPAGTKILRARTTKGTPSE